MAPLEQIATLLGVPTASLEALDRAMENRGSPGGVARRVAERNEAEVKRVTELLGVDGAAPRIRSALRKRILAHEKDLTSLVDTMPGGNEFERAAALARRITRDGKGYFLKRDLAAHILEERKPKALLSTLGVRTIAEALASHDVVELMSSLRFLETDAWMHETFEKCYRSFSPDDFEERPIEIRVLGPEWREVARKFVEKKHHNVSHLKEFGVIFLNPISEDVAGAFLRDFALLLHYFHEIEFYAELFRRAAAGPAFTSRLASLLRGDVSESYRTEPGEWLIVQRYLVKEDPNDPRLLLPRVNPESLHWRHAEHDLTHFIPEGGGFDLSFWHDLDWVGGVFDGEPVSFDLEDNAMSTVSTMEGKSGAFTYHQREALWLELFSNYVGGMKKLRTALLERFSDGVIRP